MKIVTAHTADLDAETLVEARTLLDDVFDGGLDDHDWDHSLGGVHALVREGPDLVAHGSVVQRRLIHDGRALRVGYIEAVGVRADLRRNGYGAAVMTALERVVRGAYEMGALSSAHEAVGFYAARGWRLWLGRTWALTPDGLRRTEEDDDGVYVLPVTVSPDLSGDLTCDWRDGDVW
ncbi:GNAT family N-acetyltransferase [Planotetraspora kaengkrachanensis]|uniref:Aminoglycoside N-acetyltransferase AAC(2')-Ie n=1 Tax=Planotetraspora kaengkrachanensis TaxID=575193 RepID=A0A8J3Q0N6_9ACTN|nr:GNAT family N-acetyltransferase [Planotetraspora kaengkrachanensis]GIG84739.1 aminoglycoside N-acetyltransferase AAC(2')-Ie [Planotetraspora kaengkrachanensis]